MVRGPYFDKNGLKKGAWSKEEDDKLKAYIQKYGHWNWRQLPKFAGLQRCGKSCRIRWLNYLRPDLKHGGYSKKEEELIIQLYDQLGSKWSKIAEHLPGRTDNEIKNYWHTHLKKRGRNKQTEITTPGQELELEQQPIKSSQNVKVDKESETNYPTPSIPSQPIIKILESSPSTASTSNIAAVVGLQKFGGDDPNRPWSEEEDEKLRDYTQRHGLSIWWSSDVPGLAGLLRSRESCRLRWMDYLRPEVLKHEHSIEEGGEDATIKQDERLGNISSETDAQLLGRTSKEEINNKFDIETIKNKEQLIMGSPNILAMTNLDTNNFLITVPESSIGSDDLNMGDATTPMDWINVEENSNCPIFETLEADDFWTTPFMLDLDIGAATNNNKYRYPMCSNIPMGWDQLDYIY